jgi:hypothetical protein
MGPDIRSNVRQKNNTKQTASAVYVIPQGTAVRARMTRAEEVRKQRFGIPSAYGCRVAP